MLAAALLLVLGVECELPAWLEDAPGAIRDSADLVVDGFVAGLDYRPPGKSAEVEARLEVTRSWRRPVAEVLPVLIWDYWECGPTLRFGESYVIGLKAEGDAVFALAAVRNSEAASLVSQLGSPIEPQQPKKIGQWLWTLLVSAAATIALVVAFMIGRKSKSGLG